MQYKIKHFNNTNLIGLQNEVKDWVESRNHITISYINYYPFNDGISCSITYIETNYSL